jgi:hypothetical protein
VLRFIELRAFTRRLFELGKDRADEILSLIQSDLIGDPERGRRVEGLGGIRKARCADPTRGKGKRGGFRYLYYYIERDGQIFLMLLFDKDEQGDLTREQRRSLRQALNVLKGGWP